MIPSRLLILSIVAVAVAFGIRSMSVESGADNVLVNPGFEEGVVGWDRLDGSLLVGPNARSGATSGRLITGGVSGRAVVVQDGTAFPGEWDASVFVFSSAFDAGGELTLEFYDANAIRLTQALATTDFPTVGFHELSLSLTAPAGTISFRFVLLVSGLSSSVADFDDALLTGIAAPPPTATATPTPPESPTPTPSDPGDDDDEEEAELAASLYLRNPTFESEENGLARHWRVEGGEIRHSGTLVRSGTAAGHVVGNLSTPIVASQTVRLLNENTRRFGVYALGSPPGGSVQLAIQWLLLADQPLSAPITSEPVTLDGVGYQEIFLVATPPPRAAGAILSVTIVNGAMGDNVRLDDASWRTSRSVTPGSGSEGTSPQNEDGSNSVLPPRRPDDLGALARSESQVLITEVYYAVEEGDAEWVELRNEGDEPVLLDNWALFDNERSLTLGPLLLAPGGYALIASEGAMPAGVDSAYLSPTGALGNGLANDGDHLALLDADGALVDSLSWGDDPTVFQEDGPEATLGRTLSRRAGDPDTDSGSDFESAYPTPLRGLAGFESNSEASAPADAEPDEEEESAGGIVSDDPGSSGGVSAWLLMLVVVAAVLLVAGVAAWFRRHELAPELARLRSRWWRF